MYCTKEIELDVDDIYNRLSDWEKAELLELLKEDDDANEVDDEIIGYVPYNIIDLEWSETLFRISGYKHRCMSNEDIEIIKNISKKY